MKPPSEPKHANGLPPGEMIDTIEGPRPIEHICVGDEVLTHCGRYRRVTDTISYHYQGELYCFFAGNLKARLTKAQPVYVMDPRRGPTGKADRGLRYATRGLEANWMWANGVGKGVLILVPKDQKFTDPPWISFEHKNSRTRRGKLESGVPCDPDMMRLIGYYLAEGCAGKKNGNDDHLIWSFGKHEDEYIADVKSIIEDKLGVNPSIVTQGSETHIKLYSTPVIRWFYQFGMRAYEKRIPPWIMYLPFDLQNELIKGYWRGDGSREVGFSFASVSETLLQNLRHILIRQGIMARLYKERTNANTPIRGVMLKPDRFHFKLSVAGQPLQAMSEILGEHHEQLDRSKKSSSKHMDIGDYMGVLVGVARLECNYSGPVYNLAIEDDESFVITHLGASHDYRH